MNSCQGSNESKSTLKETKVKKLIRFVRESWDDYWEDLDKWQEDDPVSYYEYVHDVYIPK